ncbi:MAG TPA: pantoate--beta-alanine ligase [Solirubrobacteraceae bacterium]|nr:pantoate--beta-alanine ligase [Solirubrobacteraceae bacterium]
MNQAFTERSRDRSGPEQTASAGQARGAEPLGIGAHGRALLNAAADGLTARAFDGHDGEMPTLRTVAELRAVLGAARAGGLTIGLVPTMGALHEGHLSLIRRARAQCDVVVVSLFVNPAQFNESADLERYPRNERDDARQAAASGADVLFAPAVAEVYPDGFATSVEVLGLTDRLEGAVRGAAHFRGVTTVVAKLLGMAAPDVMYLGQKDAQQALVIRRLVSDLNIATRIEVCPTVRERDGLALSSRNARLDPRARVRARALSAALRAAGQLAADGERDPLRLCATADTVLREAGVSSEYVELVDLDTLEPVSELDRPALLAIAARVGGVRLIDNITVQPVGVASRAAHEAVSG